MGVLRTHTKGSARGKEEGAAAVHCAEADGSGGLDWVERTQPLWNEQIPDTGWDKYKEGLLYCFHHLIQNKRLGGTQSTGLVS